MKAKLEELRAYALTEYEGNSPFAALQVIADRLEGLIAEKSVTDTKMVTLLSNHVIIDSSSDAAEIAGYVQAAMQNAHQPKTVYEDGEILGVDEQGDLVAFDADSGQRFSLGETLAEYGIHKLNQVELARVIAGARP